MRFKDFKQLPKIRKENKLSEKSQIQDETNINFRQQSETDNDLFFKAMKDVKPLKDKKGKGRIPINCKTIRSSKKRLKKEQWAHHYLQALVEGKIEFEIDLTNEYIHGNVRGLNPHIFQKLQSGQYSPESHLDLHGLTTEAAYMHILQFIKDKYLNGKRCLLIIPGRGKNSPQGRSILREQIQAWLTKDPLKRVVLAFATAQPQHGGAGALYVLLRKYKKSRGKILWERYYIEDEL